MSTAQNAMEIKSEPAEPSLTSLTRPINPTPAPMQIQYSPAPVKDLFTTSESTFAPTPWVSYAEATDRKPVISISVTETKPKAATPSTTKTSNARSSSASSGTSTRATTTKGKTTGSTDGYNALPIATPAKNLKIPGFSGPTLWHSSWGSMPTQATVDFWWRAGQHGINPHMIACAQMGWPASSFGIQPHEKERLALYEEARYSMRLW
ncbi:hypothetical protein CYLTODRAFT_421825 [Cylindrobasidium torrendii FP15055 ss-10]|uniref:Uncharacterized protein n=1 Tax=Cylindrobasidium torrendii FP15055 ss-10 TaxID=1314674 RepID=A0A0D7BF69_9AGAR|nr:hypothetical protein CYLTODRAFT_421825 [Cylindrobasidium torrendii FP15055 ss-10]